MGAKALIVHHYWDLPGGTEFVSSAFAVALDKLGFHVELGAITKFCQSCFIDWFGIDLTRYRLHALPVRLKVFGPLPWITTIWTIPRVKPDFVYVDFYQTKPIIKLKEKYRFKVGRYIHYPYEGVYGPKKVKAWKDDPYLVEVYGKFPRNVYFMVNLWLGKIFSYDNPFEVHDIIWANSRWTADLVKQIHGEYPRILNPPLPPNVEIVREPKPFEERELAVMMIGRFSLEKRYHWVISEVMPRLMKEVPGVKLIIIGGAGTIFSNKYYNTILKLAKRYGVNLEVYKSASGKLKISLMDRARAFLHATINEHWGIAVAEAMARGLPVVVHKSGGTWSDLAMNGEYGIGYNTADEAVEMLAKMLTDTKAWTYYSQKSRERINDLTFEKFTLKLRDELKLMGL